MATSRRLTPLAAIVLAAGKGTRMKSRRPKVLHEVRGRALRGFRGDVLILSGDTPLLQNETFGG